MQTKPKKTYSQWKDFSRTENARILLFLKNPILLNPTLVRLRFSPAFGGFSHYSSSSSSTMIVVVVVVLLLLLFRAAASLLQFAVYCTPNNLVLQPLCWLGGLPPWCSNVSRETVAVVFCRNGIFAVCEAAFSTSLQICNLPVRPPTSPTSLASSSWRSVLSRSSSSLSGLNIQRKRRVWLLYRHQV